MSRQKPVYLFAYETVWRMTRAQALAFIGTILTEGRASADDYGRRVRRKLSSIDMDGFDSMRPGQSLKDWCACAGHPCFDFTDFEAEDWQEALAQLDPSADQPPSGADNL